MPLTFLTFSPNPFSNKHLNFQEFPFNFLNFQIFQCFQYSIFKNFSNFFQSIEFILSFLEPEKRKKKKGKNLITWYKSWYKIQASRENFLPHPCKNFCKTGRRFQRSKEFSRSLGKHMCGDIIARVTSTSFIRTIRTFRGIEERQIHGHAPSVFSRRILVRWFFDPKQAKTALPPVEVSRRLPYSFKLVQTYCFRNMR